MCHVPRAPRRWPRLRAGAAADGSDGPQTPYPRPGSLGVAPSGRPISKRVRPHFLVEGSRDLILASRSSWSSFLRKWRSPRSRGGLEGV
eukprot:5755197-Pyramimonas_sp.AAC.1